MTEFSSIKSGYLSRRERVELILKRLSLLPPATSGLEAYKQLTETINQFEDEIWGKDSWHPPRSFIGGVSTQRFYTIFPESFFSVDNYPGVTILIGTKELIFMSRYGAIEIQNKVIEDRYGKDQTFHLRRDQVFFEKFDAYGDNVWHEKNKV